MLWNRCSTAGVCKVQDDTTPAMRSKTYMCVCICAWKNTTTVPQAQADLNPTQKSAQNTPRLQPLDCTHPLASSCTVYVSSWGSVREWHAIVDVDCKCKTRVGRKHEKVQAASFIEELFQEWVHRDEVDNMIHERRTNHARPPHSFVACTHTASTQLSDASWHKARQQRLKNHTMCGSRCRRATHTHPHLHPATSAPCLAVKHTVRYLFVIN